MTTLEQAKRRALAMGAELEVDGRRINSARQTMRIVPKTAPPLATEPAAAPAPAPDALRDLVELQVRSSTEQTAMLGRVLTEIASRFERPLPEVVEVPAKRVLPIAIRVVRDSSGRATGLDPQYGEVADGELIDLRRVTDERGLLMALIPTYAS